MYNEQMKFVEFEKETVRPMLLKSQSPSMCDGMDLEQFLPNDTSDDEEEWSR